MDRIVTKTMAEIYLQQGHLQEAYEILKALSEQEPFDTGLQKKLEELREKLGLSPSSVNQPVYSSDEKVHILERWLDNIKKKKGK